MAGAGLPEMGGLDGIEIKLNVDPGRKKDALRAFDLDPDEGKSRMIWFGEIVDGRDGPGALPLLERGVIVRVRVKKRSGDTTVKLRGPDGGIDVRAWRAGPGQGPDAKIEGDWAARRLVSGSLGHELDEATIEGLDMARPALVPLMSAEQRALAERLLVEHGRVTLLGPIRATKWEAATDGGAEAELWELGTLRFLEISVLVTADPEGAAERLRKRAERGGIDVDQVQDTKTATVLRHLAAGAGG